MKYNLIYTLIVFLPVSIFAQKKNSGFFIQSTINNIHITHPERPLDGTSVMTDLWAFGIGVHYETEFDDFFSLKNRLHFARSGYKLSSQQVVQTLVDFKNIYQFDYMGFDVLGKVSPFKSFYANLGFRFRLMIDNNLEAMIQNPIGPPAIISREDFNLTTIESNVGIGYSMERLFLELDYNYGLTPIYETNQDRFVNRIFTFSLGYNLFNFQNS